MRVLRNAHRMCKPGGLILDLTCVPPPAAVEAGGRMLGRLDQTVFLARAAETEEAVELLIREGLLREEATLPHDVRKHYDSGPELVAGVDARPHSSVPDALRRVLLGWDSAVVERVPCLLRRLRVTDGGRE